MSAVDLKQTEIRRDKATDELEALTNKFIDDAVKVFTELYGSYGEVTELTRAAFIAGLFIQVTGNSIAEMKDILKDNEETITKSNNQLEFTAVLATTTAFAEFIKCFKPLGNFEAPEV